MTKKTIKILVLIVAAISCFIALVVVANRTPAKEENKAETLGQLVDKMDELRNLKQECSDNLGIEDSAKFLQGMSGYCDSWDAEIEDIRKQVNEMQKKDYEKALGLVKSR